MKPRRMLGLFLMMAGLLFPGRVQGGQQWVEYKGGEGPGKGKHVVFVTGDEEYRSEESMPQLAKILAKHHGFDCTVLFAINKEIGEIDPNTVDNIPGLEVLKEADLMVMFTRFRELPDEQMKHIIDYTHSGKPIIGLRTATHAFNYVKNADSPYAKYTYTSEDPAGGWGREVLGETWINHYGHHKFESTRGQVVESRKDDPIVQGCEDIWGVSDVYGLTTLEGDCDPVILGVVLKGMNPDDEPNTDKPPLPVAWTKTFTGDSGKTARVFTTTMGASYDLKSEGFRRLLVNACYWALGMEGQIPQMSKVDYVGEFDPADMGFKGFKPGMKPGDFAMGE